MQQDITKLGQLGIQLGSLVSGNAGGSAPYCIDWTTVLPTQFWIVEGMSVTYQSSVTVAPPDQAFSGLFLTYGPTPPILDPAHLFNPNPADVLGRGLKISTDYQFTADSLGSTFSMCMNQRIIVPPNYKLRACIVLNNDSFAAADLPVIAQACVRVFDYNDPCCP